LLPRPPPVERPSRSEAVGRRQARRYDTRVPYTPITGTLGYVLDHRSQAVLMVHRTARADDEQLGKWNGLGGKLEADEDVASGMIRELQEEAGIEVTSMRLRATVSWPGFGPNGEDWLGFVFVVDSWTGEPPGSNEEGTLHWVPLDRLLAACEAGSTAANELPMWEGDRHFVPLLFDDDPRVVHGVMPYVAGRPVDWRFLRV
jgi:8-oxo-dGTP diphosphatase